MNIEEDITGDNRLVNPQPQVREPATDNALRPQRLAEYIGQEQVRKEPGDLYPGRPRTS